MSEAFPRTYPDALRFCAAANEKRGDVVRAAELRERAAAAESARPPIGPIAALVAGERPRSEAEAMLDRALSILEDIRADIAHPHATHAPGDGALLSRIDELRAQVETWRAAR